MNTHCSAWRCGTDGHKGGHNGISSYGRSTAGRGPDHIAIVINVQRGIAHGQRQARPSRHGLACPALAGDGSLRALRGDSSWTCRPASLVRGGGAGWASWCRRRRSSGGGRRRRHRPEAGSQLLATAGMRVQQAGSGERRRCSGACVWRRRNLQGAPHSRQPNTHGHRTQPHSACRSSDRTRALRAARPRAARPRRDRRRTALRGSSPRCAPREADSIPSATWRPEERIARTKALSPDPSQSRGARRRPQLLAPPGPCPVESTADPLLRLQTWRRAGRSAGGTGDRHAK
jgi:hypothetical protein